MKQLTLTLLLSLSLAVGFAQGKKDITKKRMDTIGLSHGRLRPADVNAFWVDTTISDTSRLSYRVDRLMRMRMGNGGVGGQRTYDQPKYRDFYWW